MLQIGEGTPTRRQLQTTAVQAVVALEAPEPHPWRRELTALARACLLLEVRLADLALEAAVKRWQLSGPETRILDNFHRWVYEPQVEIQCTKCDDGPGVRFSFSREIAITPENKRMCTGRYWVGRNNDDKIFEDRMEALTAADNFLAVQGQVMGHALQAEFRRRVQESVLELSVA